MSCTVLRIQCLVELLTISKWIIRNSLFIHTNKLRGRIKFFLVKYGNSKVLTLHYFFLLYLHICICVSIIKINKYKTNTCLRHILISSSILRIKSKKINLLSLSCIWSFSASHSLQLYYEYKLANLTPF